MRLAIDIDDTVCDTNVCWMSEYLRRFGLEGDPEEWLWSHGSVWKLGITDADAVVEELFACNETWMAIPPVAGAAQVLQNHRECVALFLSARPEELGDVTKNWLQRHRFPRRALVLRPAGVPPEGGDAWKAAYVTQHREEIDGVLDDSLDVLSLLEEMGFGGLRLHFSHLGVTPKHSGVATCSFTCWDQVDVYLRSAVGSRRHSGGQASEGGSEHRRRTV